MGRRRIHDKGLPPRLYLRNGTYWHARSGQWTKLSRDRYEALRQYAALEAGQAVQTVGQMLDEYIVSYIGANPVEPSTMESYQHLASMIRKHWGDDKLGDVDGRDVQRWMDTAKKRSSTVNAARFFKMVMERARKWGYVERNPLDVCDFPKLPRRQRVLSEDEISKIRAHLHPPIRALVDITLLLSCRVSEVCGIRLRDIGGATLRLRRQKTKDVLPFTITPELRALLEEARGMGGKISSMEFLMLNERRKPFDPRYVSQAFSAAAKRAGLEDVRFHDLRRSSLNMDRSTAQARAGHADARTTRGYLVGRDPVMPLVKKETK